ncbi:hypothetical protein OIO90_003657 [Microbotryomycetes sp. JL221]|nr:hypothetical protein OIO90_003657 [Microbotryomycetes sp. JL221]
MATELAILQVTRASKRLGASSDLDQALRQLCEAIGEDAHTIFGTNAAVAQEVVSLQMKAFYRGGNYDTAQFMNSVLDSLIRHHDYTGQADPLELVWYLNTAAAIDIAAQPIALIITNYISSLLTLIERRLIRSKAANPVRPNSENTGGDRALQEHALAPFYRAVLAALPEGARRRAPEQWRFVQNKRFECTLAMVFTVCTRVTPR